MQLTYVSRPGADRAANTRLGKVCKANCQTYQKPQYCENLFFRIRYHLPPDWDLRRGIRWANRLFMQQRPSASNHTVRAVFCQFLPSREGTAFLLLYRFQVCILKRIQANRNLCKMKQSRRLQEVQ